MAESSKVEHTNIKGTLIYISQSPTALPHAIEIFLVNSNSCLNSVVMAKVGPHLAQARSSQEPLHS